MVRGRRAGREEERVMRITLLPKAWDMSPKEVSSSLFDCWNMLSHWENCSFLTCSGEFYCGHILAIYMYKCVRARRHTHTHTHTHAYNQKLHVCTQGFKDFGKQILQWTIRTWVYWPLTMNWVQFVWSHFAFHFFITKKLSSEVVAIVAPFCKWARWGSGRFQNLLVLLQLLCDRAWAHTQLWLTLKSESPQNDRNWGSRFLRVLTVRNGRIASGSLVPHSVKRRQDVGPQGPGNAELGLYPWHETFVLISSCEPVMVSFMCQFGWTKRTQIFVQTLFWMLLWGCCFNELQYHLNHLNQ